MRPVPLLLLGAAAYGAFLLATVPAGLVSGRAATATGGRVTLTNAAGTVWKGSARASVAAPGATFAVDEVRWQFLPLRLLAGRAAYQVEARMAGLEASMEAARSPGQWQLRDLQAGGDAAALAAFFPLAVAWQPAGTIAIEAPHLAWDGRNATGTATAEWREAVLSLSAARPLGSWRAQASAEGAAAKITLATTRGPLQLSGNGTLALPGHLSFSGEARAEPGSERDLEAVLDLLGPRRADGARALAIR